MKEFAVDFTEPGFNFFSYKRSDTSSSSLHFGKRRLLFPPELIDNGVDIDLSKRSEIVLIPWSGIIPLLFSKSR